MIAKASTISHGANAIRYSVNKEKADIVKHIAWRKCHKIFRQQGESGYSQSQLLAR